MVIKAFFVALRAHFKQRDKSGKPYIFHPITVSRGVKGAERKAVALLHDVVEDTNYTLCDLEKMGFKKEIVLAVEAITKVEGEAYDEYLNRVKQNEIARDVKLSDLKHNSNLNRLKVVTQKDLDRVEKYKYATEFLRS